MKKIMTFEEEKRLEKVKDSYSTLFIIATFVFIIRLLAYFLLEKFAGTGAATQTFLELVFRSVAVFLPFFIYGRIKGVKLERGKSSARTALGATLFLCGFSAAIYFPTQKLFEFLIADGFVFEEPYPIGTQSVLSSVIFVVAVPLVSAAVTEYSLRTVALGSVAETSHGFSVAAVVILNICLYPEWSALPFTVVSAILLSIVFVKTKSTATVFIASFLSRAVTSAAKVFSAEKLGIITVIIGAAVAAVGLILLITDKNLRRREKPEDAFTKKEGFSALFKSSVLYMLIFVSAVQTFYFYAKKPEKDEGSEVRCTVETQKVLSFGITEEKL